MVNLSGYFMNNENRLKMPYICKITKKAKNLSALWEMKSLASHPY